MVPSVVRTLDALPLTGDRVALVGSGIGFSWARTVLKIEETVPGGDR